MASYNARLASLLLRIGPCLLVALHTLNEFLPALRMADVLHPDVDALLDVAVANYLVDDNTNGVGSDVVNDAGTAVVEFVRHALLLSSVGLDVDDVSDTVVDKECGQLDRAMFCV